MSNMHADQELYQQFYDEMVNIFHQIHITLLICGNLLLNKYFFIFQRAVLFRLQMFSLSLNKLSELFTATTSREVSSFNVF